MPIIAYIIGEDDVLSINVWKEPDITRLILVRSDGKISLPLIGEVQAAGRTPAQLQQDIADKLRSYITDPQVTVIVQEIHSQKFNILGEVNKPGSYPLSAGTTILDAIAIGRRISGTFAKQEIHLRPPPEFLRAANPGFPLTTRNLSRERTSARNIKIEPHDTVVVP